MDNLSFITECESEIAESIKYVDYLALYNQKKVLKAFSECRVESRHFIPSNGYAYGDIGREKLCQLFSRVFSTQSAIVSPMIASGTHAISLCLHGILRPGDNMLCASGKPYDTICPSIFFKGCGSLVDYSIQTDIIDLVDSGFNIPAILNAIKEKNYKMLYIQRSRGYEWRKSLCIAQIEELICAVKKISKNIVVFVDNCYGEFTEVREPSDAGADIIAGSLIKNPGGGIAPGGGYIAGREDLVTLCSYKLTVPGIGLEIGANAAGYLPYFQGLFFAPHVVAQALKSSLLFGEIFRRLGYKTIPEEESLTDITRAVIFNDADKLTRFCRAIQENSPIDSHIIPTGWEMPGYSDDVIMAAGTFVQGASIELTCDGPMRPPYIAYLQGTLTYEHAKIAALACLDVLK